MIELSKFVKRSAQQPPPSGLQEVSGTPSTGALPIYRPNTLEKLTTHNFQTYDNVTPERKA